MSRGLAVAAALLALTGLASGCPYRRSVDLAHPEAIARAEPPAEPKGTIAIGRFRDARTADDATGQQVGQIRESYGIPIVPVDAAQDPVAWVTDALARGLMLRGYAVERIDSPQAAASRLVLDGSVVRVFADRYLTVAAEIVADVALVRDGASLWSGRCEASGSELVWFVGLDEFHSILVAVVDRFTSECVGQIVAAVERAESPRPQ